MSHVGLLDDKCLGEFTGTLVGNANDGGIGDQGVVEKNAFQLGRGNLVALD